MTQNNDTRPELTNEMLEAAFRDAFLKAAEISKQTNTPLITSEEDGTILEVPPHKIDDYVTHVKNNLWKY